LNTLIKAAQTISAEVLLGRLLERLLGVLIENAGAQRGVLLLSRDDELYVEAEGSVLSDEVAVVSIPIDSAAGASLVPIGVINFAARTKQVVVVANAQQDERFMMDPYVQKRETRSVLCQPILNQGQMIGIVYLENDLTSGAFTPERTHLLSLLSGQIAVSIKNAELVEHLEQKVRERTHQLELANLAKSRFLAVASHDLRQPLHALGLFVAQLRTAATAGERTRVIGRIDTAIATMNELFKALLDISRLDAGALASNVTEFPMIKLLERVDATFAGAAADAGLNLRVVPNSAWVRSDFVLLEQVLLNLVSNAVRYTARGGVLIGCRKRGEQLRIEVWDTGPGIPDDQRQRIFEEFYRLDDMQGDRKGLGLGLAIVDRLCRLLGHSLELSSAVGRGSRFSVMVPQAAEALIVAEPPMPALGLLHLAVGKLIVVIDDDALVLDGMAGLLRSWGCRVVAARSAQEALADLIKEDGSPDLIISDFHLFGGRTGIGAIEELHAAVGAPIPAFLVSGDISPALLEEARHRGYHLLHKPVDPMSLRTMLNRLVKKSARSLPFSPGNEV